MSVEKIPDNKVRLYFLNQMLWIILFSFVQLLPYSGKLSREKTFANFKVLQLFMKVFSAKLGGMASFGSDTSEQSVKVFSAKVFSAKIFFRENLISAKSHHVVMLP